MWLVVALTEKANRCGMRNVQLFRLDPNPKLFAYHHSQEAEQGDDGRAGLFTRIRPYKIPTPRPTTKDMSKTLITYLLPKSSWKSPRIGANVTSRKGA
jgi:hypothetical protein